MDGKWTKDMIVTVAITRTELSGGMTAQERSALAERFGISEEVLVRCERANHAYYASISSKQYHQARIEALCRMKERGELRGELDKDKYLDEFDAALSRIRDTTPENEITRELDEAWAALRAALDASTSPPEQ